MFDRCAAGLFLFAALGGAELVAQSIELAELERSALESSPILAEAVARRDAARALVEGSTVAGDPTLELWARNVLPELTDRADTRSAIEVEIVQPVRFPGKRDAARNLANAVLEVAEAELAGTRRKLIAAIRRSFAALGAADREQRSLAESHELLELLSATALARFGSGQEGALAVLEAELAIDEHDLELDRVYSSFLAERARLAALAGAWAETLPLLVGARPEPLPLAEGALPIDPEAPRFVVAERRIAVAERQLELARLDRRPNFGLGGGFLWPDGEAPVLTAKVGVDLPLFRRRRVEPKIHAAEANLAAERAAASALGLAANADAARWGAERDRLERALSRLTGAVIPRTSAALDAARAAFLEGQLPFSRLLELQNDWFHARVELAKAEAERFAIWAEWQELAPPEWIPPEAEPSASTEVKP